MIYVTGDTHGEWNRFSSDSFPEQKEMTRDDFVIVCGDFGLWNDTPSEQWWLKWLEEKSFTLLFCDGNHENFDRLYSDEFPIVDFHGGKAHKIRENIYHLMRGHVFDLDGKMFFVFGGASCHDVSDGILDERDYPNFKAMINDYRERSRRGEMIRVNHLSWWKEELPSEEEMAFGLKTLAQHGNKVDFIVSHCCPQQIASLYSFGAYKPDKLTEFFNEIAKNTEFKKWFFGHYHNNQEILNKYVMLYEQIIRIE